MTKLGQFIKSKRNSLNMTRQQLGDLIGVSGQYVYNVESGRHDNPETFCFKFAQRILDAKDSSKLEKLLKNHAEETLLSKKQKVVGIVSSLTPREVLIANISYLKQKLLRAKKFSRIKSIRYQGTLGLRKLMRLERKF